jgi:2-polyprenyl-3-methyl-5-hydroxy-6-metoxy-1,4-benzoquinol methylase
VNPIDHLRTSASASTETRYQLVFPEVDPDRYDQDEEWCEVIVDGEARSVRFHDYDEIYSLPGLYEQLFYDVLKCDSPRTVCELLAEQVEACGESPEKLRVLDVGAGNGMVGEQLRKLGAEMMVGVDIIPEAAEAAERDRPDVYDDYYVVNLMDLSDETRAELDDHDFNSMVCVAALGFGDIPPNAFAEAFNMVETGGHVAFNIKEDFMSDEYETGFSALIRHALDDGTLELEGEMRSYRHRLSATGRPLQYLAASAIKRRDLEID